MIMPAVTHDHGPKIAAVQGDLTMPGEADGEGSQQAFTYYAEFDHTSMSISSVHIGPNSAPEPKRLSEERLTGADIFAGVVRCLPQRSIVQAHSRLKASLLRLAGIHCAPSANKSQAWQGCREIHPMPTETQR